MWKNGECPNIFPINGKDNDGYMWICDSINFSIIDEYKKKIIDNCKKKLVIQQIVLDIRF